MQTRILLDKQSVFHLAAQKQMCETHKCLLDPLSLALTEDYAFSIHLPLQFKVNNYSF